MPKLVIIQGPTGVGKSQVAIDLALRIDAEIINADSQQIYRHLDIGTAKPTVQERWQVPHHLIDAADPDEDFNAALFRSLALRCAREIESRGRKVFVCGGTGLYVKALLHGLFREAKKAAGVRSRLLNEIRDRGPAALHERLRVVDPESAARIHPNDGLRVVRALEVFEATGKKLSDWHKEHRFGETAPDSLKIGLNRDREELYDRIDRRCEEMIRNGLLEEVEGLRRRGYDLDLRPLRSIGYRHVGLYLQGKIDLERAIGLMKRDTRRLAKRQLTWLRADRAVLWFHPDRERDRMFAAIQNFYGSE